MECALLPCRKYGPACIWSAARTMCESGGRRDRQPGHGRAGRVTGGRWSHACPPLACTPPATRTCVLSHRHCNCAPACAPCTPRHHDGNPAERLVGTNRLTHNLRHHGESISRESGSCTTTACLRTAPHRPPLGRKEVRSGR